MAEADPRNGQTARGTPPASFESTVRELIGQSRLRFPSVLERVFRVDYYEKSKAMMRIALALGIALYTSFGFLDRFLAPDSYRQIWFIRYAIVDPFILLGLLLSFFPFFRTIAQIALSFIALVAGLGIIAMIILLGRSEAALSYYAGLILVLMWAYTFPRMLFKYASVAGWLVVLGYEMVAIFHLKMLQRPETVGVFVNNNFFFISANVMGMIVSFLLELAARRDFLQTQLIAEEQTLLERERNELRERNRLIGMELEMARAVQQSLIPRELPSEKLHAIYKPMEEVGGDYYDFLRLDGGRKIGIFVSDVAGHGVPAALIASMIKTVLSESTHLQDRPDRLMTHLNESLFRQIEKYFVTAFYGIYDFGSRTLTWTNAGHPPPLLCDGSKVRELSADKAYVPLGFLENSELQAMGEGYRAYRATLSAGAKLLLFTDGLTEATRIGERKHQFADVIEGEFLRLCPLAPKPLLEGLQKSLIEFRGGEEFEDDICVICLDVT